MSAICPEYKIDSNNTGLRFAIERCLRELPTLAVDGFNPTWYPLEPNSYNDFGASITTVARNPINPSRQPQKGTVTDLEATAGYQSDLTNTNHMAFLEGFMFARARQKPTTHRLGLPATPATAVSAASGYVVGATLQGLIPEGALVHATGFGSAANNGVKVVTGSTGGSVLAAGLVDEASPSPLASVSLVGVRAEAGTLSLHATGGVVSLRSTDLDFTTLGLVRGEWIYVGGDSADTFFGTQRGFARVDSISDDELTFGKIHWNTPVEDLGVGKTIELYFGTVIKNEEDPALIRRTTYQFERTLGQDADGTMSQYVIGAVANEFTLNVQQADKITADFGFIACDSPARSGAVGLKGGLRPSLVASDAFNSSSDVRRISFGIVGDPAPLFMYATDFTLTINNNASGLKAIGVLGNMDITTGMFSVGGSVTAYFQDVRAINAVRDNLDVTMDVIMVKKNAGIAFDVPLLALGNGLPNVEQDQAITVPLDTMAAQSIFGHTLLYVNFPYLPNAA